MQRDAEAPLVVLRGAHEQLVLRVAVQAQHLVVRRLAVHHLRNERRVILEHDS